MLNDRWTAIHHNYLEPPLLNDVNAKLAFEPEDLAPYEKTKIEALTLVWDAMPPNMVRADKVAAMKRAHVALAQSYLKHGLTQDMQAAALKASSAPGPRLTDLERELLDSCRSLVEALELIGRDHAVWWPHDGDLVVRARSAIAKATGGES